MPSTDDIAAAEAVLVIRYTEAERLAMVDKREGAPPLVRRDLAATRRRFRPPLQDDVVEHAPPRRQPP